MDLPQQAGPLLRRARHLARLSQEEFAAAAGIRQSVVSDYERGRREPPLSTLRRLVRAAGYDLVLSLAEPFGDGPALLGARGNEVRKHREAIVAAFSDVGLVRPRVIGRVAQSCERWFDPVEFLADRGPNATDKSHWVRGILSTYTGCEVIVRISDDLGSDELDDLEAGAVLLTAVEEDVAGTEPDPSRG